MVPLGFCLREQLPSFCLHAAHIIKQVIAEPFFVPLACLYNRLRDEVLWRGNPAGDIKTRFAMFRNGSRATRAFSIAALSGLAQARQV
jgi:hypothetical protein